MRLLKQRKAKLAKQRQAKLKQESADKTTATP